MNLERLLGTIIGPSSASLLTVHSTAAHCAIAVKPCLHIAQVRSLTDTD